MHLILGVAGGIVLGVYALATIERWRARRQDRKEERRIMAMLYPPPPPQPMSNTDARILSVAGMGVAFGAVLILLQTLLGGG